MEFQLINNFAAAAKCAFKDFGTVLEGYCNAELIGAEQVSNIGDAGLYGSVRHPQFLFALEAWCTMQ